MKYTTEIVQQITALIRDEGLTIQTICKRVGISEAIFYKWQDEKIEFFEEIKKARQEAIEQRLIDCKLGLSKLITGYEYEEVKTVIIKGKDGQPEVKEKITTQKVLPPNLGAIIYYQTNKDPVNWKNRQYNEIIEKPQHIDLEALTDDELKQLASIEEKLAGNNGG